MEHYEIIFYNPINGKKYPEAVLYGKNCIVVEAISHIIISGKNEITLSVDGKVIVYKNVWAIRPYHYEEG